MLRKPSRMLFASPGSLRLRELGHPHPGQALLGRQRSDRRTSLSRHVSAYSESLSTLIGSPVMDSTPLGALAAAVLTSWGSTFIVLLVDRRLRRRPSARRPARAARTRATPRPRWRV